MRLLIATVLFITAIFACSGTKKASVSNIDVVTLHNYLLNPDVSFSADITYTFNTNATEFHRMFYMTKASFGTVVVPDFSTKAVVSIILKPTEKVVSVDINKAEIAGSNLNIYYTITDTTSWKSFSHTPMAVAMVAKSKEVKKVNFYSGRVLKKTLIAQE